MNDDTNDRDLTITGAHEGQRDSHVGIHESNDGVIIVIEQIYGPAGDPLVGISEVTFDGFPAVTIGVRADGKEGLVHLSPIHGDPRKRGFVDIRQGTKCELFCPVSKQLLPKVADVDDGSGADYYALFLTSRCDESSMVLISDVWGHYHSRIVDNMELISYWARTHEG